MVPSLPVLEQWLPPNNFFHATVLGLETAVMLDFPNVKSTANLDFLGGQKHPILTEHELFV